MPRALILLVLLVLAGCDLAFGLALNPDAAPIPIDAPPERCLVEDFGDTRLAPERWVIADPHNYPVTVRQQGGELQITLAPFTNAYNGIVSPHSYDMHDAAIEVELAQPMPETGYCEAFIELSDAHGGGYYLIDTGAGSIVYRQVRLQPEPNPNEVRNQVADFDPAFRYWRFAHDSAAQRVQFATSTDRVTWVERFVVPDVVPVDALVVLLLAGCYQGRRADPGAAHWDNLRLVSPRCP